MSFTANVDRDARLVLAGMYGGFEAVCAVAMQNPEFAGGPSVVLAHADWLKSQPEEYIKHVASKAAEMERGGP